MATISGEIHQFKNKAGTKNWWPRTVTEAIYGLDSTIADVKTWVGNNYVSALGTNGNYLTWTKGGTANNITVPYATTADGANHAFWLSTNNTIAFGKSGLQYFSVYGTEGTSPTANNTPTSAWYHILRMNHGDSDGYFADIAIHLSGSNGIYWRRIAGGTNLGWFRVLDSNNFASIIGTTTYAPYNSYGYMYGTVDTNIVEQNGSETDTWANLGYADSHKGKADFKIVRHTNGVGAHFGGIGMNYGSTIFYGSSDTRGYMSLAYSAPLIVFGGGSLGTSSASAAPAWYIGIKGTSGTTYDLGAISSQAANGDSAYNSLGNYLPLKAQGETIYRTTSGQIVNFNNSKGANEEAYFVLQSNSTSKAAVGWSTTFGVYIYNYPSAKYLGIKDDGTPHYQGNTLLHANNYTSFQGGYANVLRDVDYHDASHRRTAGNVTFADGGLHYFLASYLMTDAGRPEHDGQILQCAWDNSTYDSQLFIPSGGINSDDNAHVKVRGQNGQGSWNSWHTLYDDVNLNMSKIINIMGGSLPEAYLGWGGRNYAGSFGPLDAAMVSEFGANRFAFAKPGGIVVEYSTDAGTTWTDYGAGNDSKTALFSNGSSFTTGKNTTAGGGSANNMLRVTLRTGAAQIYTVLYKFVIYCSTQGSSGSYCTIRCRTQQNYENNVDTWVTVADHVSIAGYSGYNVINYPTGVTTYGNQKASQYGEWQFIFGCTGFSGNSYGLTIYNIWGYGGVGWTTPSTMAKTGHLYGYDSNQTAYFPSSIIPATNGNDLGGPSYRWELYATSGNFSGAVSIPQISGLGRIEFDGTSSSSGNGGYMDFHFNGSTADYTSRIIESASGLLRINSCLNVDGNTGRVGIGTYAPACVLEVLYASDPGSSGQITSQFLTWGSNPYGIVFRGFASGAHAIQVERRGTSSEFFPLALQHRGGNVGVGTITPSYKLDVVGVIHSTVGIFSDGYVSALGTASSSDAKLKDDITTISYDRAKEVLSALNPREWTWNSLTSKEGERGAGMVAQEVEPILPDTVKEIGGNLTLEYNTLFAYGLAMTKYLVPAVESLEERVTRLERENEELKRQLTN